MIPRFITAALAASSRASTATASSRATSATSQRRRANFAAAGATGPRIGPRLQCRPRRMHSIPQSGRRADRRHPGKETQAVHEPERGRRHQAFVGRCERRARRAGLPGVGVVHDGLRRTIQWYKSKLCIHDRVRPRLRRGGRAQAAVSQIVLSTTAGWISKIRGAEADAYCGAEIGPRGLCGRPSKRAPSRCTCATSRRAPRRASTRRRGRARRTPCSECLREAAGHPGARRAAVRSPRS